jgi:aminoglycoside phosphotransferase family enzyme/predicted kinase
MQRQPSIRQEQIFDAMAKADFYPHPVTSVEQKDTHISKVFLTGDYVYKIKKSVDLDFLDFSNLDNRRYFCQQEVMLNRRLTTGIYLEVVPIMWKDKQFCFGETGEVIDYAVKMRQLPDHLSMMYKIRRKEISHSEIQRLAEILADFYQNAKAGDSIDKLGSWETVRKNCEENFDQTAGFSGTFLDEKMYRIVRGATNAFLKRHKALFQQRVRAGKIRDCHGDLRTGHIYFADEIQIIDCIEFNDRFRYSDITADLAFLTMDLDFESAEDTATEFLTAYVDISKDRDIFVLLNFYKCYRAFVRCKVNCFRLETSELGRFEREKLLRQTHQYLKLAYTYAIRFTRPTLWIVCGLPASGKSTIARNLSKELDVGVIRSDKVRKKLFHISDSQTVDVPFEKGIYSQGSSALTYGKLYLKAQEKLEKDESVIIDASFSKSHQREEVVRLACDVDANVVFVECTASSGILKKRLLKREKEPGLSDARLNHLKDFISHFEPLDDIREDLRINVDTTVSIEESMRQILSQDYILEKNR